MTKHNESGNESDQILAQRYVDRELRDHALAQFEQRLLQSNELRAVVDELRTVRAMFAPERDQRPPAPAGFAAKVLTAVRRLPSRAELLAEPGERGEAELITQSVERVGRRLVIAAALLFALALVIVSGWFPALGSGKAEASQDEVRQLIEQIKSRDGAGAVSPRGR